MALRPTLAALAAALSTLAAPAAAAPAARGAARAVPVLHTSLGTGACTAPRSGATAVDNPCWLQLGVAPGVRLGALELGLAYEGRELVKLLSFALLQPPAATTLGASAAWVVEPGERWRLSAGGEAGWRRYADFAGSGLRRREGAVDVPYLGAVGRAALGLRPPTGRADRLEVSLALRSDLGTGHATVGQARWSAGGWSVTMSIGLVSEW